MEASTILENSTLLIIIIGILILIAVILTLIERRIKKQPVKNEDESFYLRNIKRNLAKKKGEEALNYLNKVSKLYFEEKYQLNTKSDYSELKDFFIRNKKNMEADFCDIMINLYYSKDTLSNEDIKKAASRLSDIIKRR